MTTESDRERLREYLAAQSAKRSVVEIRERLAEEAERFLAALEGLDDAAAHRRPGADEWSVAEVVDHVTVTLDDVTGVMRALISGLDPRRPMTVGARPATAARPLPELVAALRQSQAAVSALLDGARGEPHTDARVPDHEFGAVNWKAYALILRLHYKDHVEQVRRTAAAVSGPRPGDRRPP